jgi:hypothetical protein
VNGAAQVIDAVPSATNGALQLHPEDTDGARSVDW